MDTRAGPAQPKSRGYAEQTNAATLKDNGPLSRMNREAKNELRRLATQAVEGKEAEKSYG